MSPRISAGGSLEAAPATQKATIDHFLRRIADYVFWCPASSKLGPSAEPTARPLAATWIRRSRVYEEGQEVGQLELRWHSDSQLQEDWSVEGQLQLGTGNRVELRGAGLARDHSSYFAAVLDLRDGSGFFAGRSGLLVLNGGRRVSPLHTPAATLLALRLEAGPQILQTEPLAARPAQVGAEGLFVLRGWLNQDEIATFHVDSRGQIEGARVREYLFRADQAQAAPEGRSWRPRGVLRRTLPLGYIDFHVRFEPTANAEAASFTTRDAVFTFHDAAGHDVGQLRANMQLGRAFATPISGVPVPAFRMGGLAPIQSGSGLFENATGLITVNSVLGIEPQFVSSVFLVRIDDH